MVVAHFISVLAPRLALAYYSSTLLLQTDFLPWFGIAEIPGVAEGEQGRAWNGSSIQSLADNRMGRDVNSTKFENRRTLTILLLFENDLSAN
jgi:hypothetical protein